MNSNQKKAARALSLPDRAMTGKTYDAEAAAKELAALLHGQPAAHKDHKPERLEEYLSTGSVFIDSVDGDAIEATWALPTPCGQHHKVASLRMIVGTSHSGLPSIMCYLKGNDGHTSVYHGRAETSVDGYPEAAQALWSEMFGDPWTTLMGHIPGKYGEGHSYINNVPTLAFAATILSILAQLALVVLLVSHGGQHYWTIFRLEYVLAGVAVTMGALTIVQVYRHIGLRHYRKANIEIITKGLTGGGGV